MAPDYSTSTYITLSSYPVDLGFNSSGDMVVTSGGTLYKIPNPGVGDTTATTIATYFGTSLEGVIFDDSDNLFIDSPDGTVIKVTGF